MVNQGYRSIQVVCTNDTRGNLVVQGPQLGTGCNWIEGEQPRQGDPLNQYQSAVWGVSTNNIDAGATGGVQLTGLGSLPITMEFMIRANGQASCEVTSNDAIRSLVTQDETAELNHVLFSVQLVPVVANSPMADPSRQT